MFTLWSPVCLGHAHPPGILQIGTAALLYFFVCLVQFHLEFRVFEQSVSEAQGGLEFMLLLPQPPVFWDHRTQITIPGLVLVLLAERINCDHRRMGSSADNGEECVGG